MGLLNEPNEREVYCVGDNGLVESNFEIVAVDESTPPKANKQTKTQKIPKSNKQTNNSVVLTDVKVLRLPVSSARGSEGNCVRRLFSSGLSNIFHWQR